MASNCTRMLDVAALVFEGNVRTPECMSIPAIVESFRRHRYKSNHPLVVSEKTTPDGPRYLVLCGNRRGLGLVWLRENEPETFNLALNGSGKVPGIVHKGLTKEEEVELRIDHSSDEDRVPLDEWSLFMAVKQLVQAGIDTQERIAVKLGLFKQTGKQKGQPRREFVQVRVNLVRLPEYVQDEFRKLTLDKATTLVRWSHVASLYKAYNQEYVEHPDGKGPEFSALWQKIITPPEATEEGATPNVSAPKELTPAEAVKRSQSASSDGLKQALLAVTHQSKADLSEIDAHLVRAESALLILADVADYLGESEYNVLLENAGKQGDTKREQAQADAAAEETIVTDAEYVHPAA